MAYSAPLIPALAVIGQILASPTLAFPLNTSSLAGNSTTPSACDNIYSCRTPWNLVYGCIITIFACTYLSFHPDIPDRTHTLWRIRLTHICSVLIGFLVPELMVARAAFQWRQVRKFIPEFQGWTRTHSYFTLMGGFDGCGTSPHLRLLNPTSYPEMFKKNAPAHTEGSVSVSAANELWPVQTTINGQRVSPLEVTTPPSSEHRPSNPKIKISVTESEILDKSKSDPLGKLFTVLQTAWFIVQYLERWITRQPRTQLEVMTLAYAALNILTYALWWEKPLNIQEPIDVRGRSSAHDEDRTRGLHGVGAVLGPAFRLPSLRADDDIVFFSMVFPLVGILFGGIHCIAWWFPFPSGPEKVLWRVCAVYCTATPCFVSITCFVRLAPYNRLPGWVNHVLSILSEVIEYYHELISALVSAQSFEVQVVFTAALPLIPYMTCRVILVVLTFTSLRAPPPGVYEATSWPSFLPHFG